MLTMGLTWRDTVSGAAIVMIVLAYAAYLAGTRLLLVSSAWATSAVVLVLGFGCAASATGDLYTRPQPRSGVVVRRVTAGIGIVALTFGLTGIVADSQYALRNLVAVMIMFWATATLWHVFTMGSDQ